MKKIIAICLLTALALAAITCKKTPEIPDSTNKIVPPTVITNDVSGITTTSATSGGNVTSNGNGAVASQGVCWNTTGNPTLENNIGSTNDGNGTVTYTSQLTGLTENTTYFVAAYVTNEKGTAYGEVVQFSTLPLTIPTLTTIEISDITTTSATSGGNVTNNGNGIVTSKGVCWNTSGNPTLENNISFTNEGAGTGTFTSQLTGLTENTNYFVAAYATNEKGTAYGNILAFITLYGFTDPRDGQSYIIIDIGNQTWMAENLNYVTGNSWCYDNNNSNCETYGRLYDWETIMNGESSSNAVPSGVQGICPPGWHLPSDVEWTILTDYLGGEDIAGGKMKETGTTHWSSPNAGTTNSSGFSALPCGYRYTSGNFYNIGSYGYWWSATEYSSTNAWYRSLYYYNSQVYRYYDNRVTGFSVRCLKD